jgi:hypothetical protein
MHSVADAGQYRPAGRQPLQPKGVKQAATKIYELYPTLGGFSVKTIDYHGTLLKVAATSVRQAYAVAYKDVWINPADDHPVGIVLIHRRNSPPSLWCGCSGHGVTGGHVNHGDGIRALRAAIAAHQCGTTEDTARR